MTGRAEEIPESQPASRRRRGDHVGAVCQGAEIITLDRRRRRRHGRGGSGALRARARRSGHGGSILLPWYGIRRDACRRGRINLFVRRRGAVMTEQACAHVDQIQLTDLPASISGCEECLKTGSRGCT